MLLIELKINKDTKKGLTAISLVNEPAILTNFIKLKKEDQVFKFAVEKDKQIVMGPVLIPQVKIYRNDVDGKGTEGMIYFSAETIEELMELYMEEEKNNSVTLQHKDITDKVKMRESWIVTDSEKDKSAFFGLEVPVGTWMASYKVNDINLWKEIKDGELNGFSIEAQGLLNIVKGEVLLGEEKEIKIITEDLSLMFISRLKSVGHSQESLETQGYKLVTDKKLEKLILDFDEIKLNIEADTKAKSFLDKNNYIVRYSYKGPRDDKNRDFCAQVLDANLLFRKEDINQMSFRTENKDFGTYSIFDFKGSYNCRHSWNRLVFVKDGTDLKKSNSKILETLPNDAKGISKNEKVKLSLIKLIKSFK